MNYQKMQTAAATVAVVGVIVIVAMLGIVLMNQSKAKPVDPVITPITKCEDIDTVVRNFGKATSEGDHDGDGRVTVKDLSIVLSRYQGGPCKSLESIS